MAEYAIGIDIGGTFTDCAVLDEAGRVVTIAKAPSNRAAPDQGVMESVAAAARRLGIPRTDLLARTRLFIHGCTVATNAMVERKGVRTGLITTHGHEDVMFIGKVGQKSAGLSERDLIHQSKLDKANPPLIDYRLVKGVAERIDRYGDIIVPLDEAAVDAAADALVAAGCEAVAVSFLWSFLNPVHERRAADRIRARHPELFVCASADLVPVIGEYERTVTAAATAYVGPRVTRYIARLGQSLKEDGYRFPLMIAHCMGGLTTMEEVADHPLLTLDSGPVSGVLGARFFSHAYDEPNLMCADMGGTTFDVALIEKGGYVLDEEPVIAQYTYLVPKVAVESVGAGGGSIVWVDADGLLHVGPHSAGSDPGPVCYGAGGSEPTVTDIDLVLGFLDPTRFLGGEMALDAAAAEAAIDRVAARMGTDRMTVAGGAFTIVNAHMADLMRRTSIDRGRDPRDFGLISYGGAGAMHIAYLARELKMRRVYVPSFATVFSAFGMLTGGLSHSAEASVNVSFPLANGAREALAAAFGRLEGQLGELFAREGVDEGRRAFARAVFMKYRSQPRAIPVAVPEDLTSADASAEMIASFQDRYGELYGRNVGYAAAGVEAIRVRVEGHADTVAPDLAKVALGGADAAAALRGQRRVFFPEIGAYRDTPIYDGEMLKPGMQLSGPAVVERMGDTIVVPSFARLSVDGFSTVVLDLEQEARTRA